MPTPSTIATPCESTARTTVLSRPVSITRYQRKSGTELHSICALPRAMPSRISSARMTAALIQRPQCRSRTIGSSASAIDRGLLHRALLDAPGLEDLAVGAVGDQLLQRLLHGFGERPVLLVEADSVGATVDRLTWHDLEELAVTRRARDVNGARQVVEDGGDAAGAQLILVLVVAVGRGDVERGLTCLRALRALLGGELLVTGPLHDRDVLAAQRVRSGDAVRVALAGHDRDAGGEVVHEVDLLLARLRVVHPGH